MKRMIAILLAVMLMCSVFTACAGTLDTGMGYGNVSTTPNGYVNGGYNGGNTYNGNRDQNNDYAGRHGDYGGRYYDGTFHGRANENGTGSINSNGSTGSGMTGGR